MLLSTVLCECCERTVAYMDLPCFSVPTELAYLSQTADPVDGILSVYRIFVEITFTLVSIRTTDLTSGNTRRWVMVKGSRIAKTVSQLVVERGIVDSTVPPTHSCLGLSRRDDDC